MSSSDDEKVEYSLNDGSETTIDGFDVNEVSQNEFWEENGFLGHLLAIAIMTITIVLFV